MQEQSTTSMTLTHAQRKLLAELLPILADRLRIDEAGSRTADFTSEEIQEIVAKCQAAMPEAENGRVWNSLRHIIAATGAANDLAMPKKISVFEAFRGMIEENGSHGVESLLLATLTRMVQDIDGIRMLSDRIEEIEEAESGDEGGSDIFWKSLGMHPKGTRDRKKSNKTRRIAAEAVESHKTSKGGRTAADKMAHIPAAERVYQFKITLKHSEPPIWRRIQTKDCTLDDLHAHIQTAMGWSNSHLHQFKIDGVAYGDPEVVSGGWDGVVDTLKVNISELVLDNDAKRFRFDYEYDFGDSWHHEILFERCIQAEKGTRYPLCMEGERACPPEDIGGIYDYQYCLEAQADPEHEEHESYMEWPGPFNPETFDPQAVTKKMQRGLPDRRSRM